MAPSPTAGLVFTETQWFYRRWWWLILSLSILLLAPLALVFNKLQGPKVVAVTIPLLLVVLIGLCFMKLTVRVDAIGIHYHYPPVLTKWRHWPWSEFRQVFPRSYSPFGDYGGWGIRGLPGNLAYNVWGPAGLQLIFRSGNRLLLGTQQPAELQEVLAALHATNRTLPITLSGS